MDSRKGDVIRRVIAVLILAGIAVLAFFAVRFGIQYREQIRESQAQDPASHVEITAGESAPDTPDAVLEAEAGKQPAEKVPGEKVPGDGGAGGDAPQQVDEAARTEELLNEQTKLANQENAEILKELIVAAVPDVSEYLAASRGVTASANLIICLDPARQATEMTETERLGPALSTRTQKMLPGAQGVTTGSYEYEITLEICIKLREELVRRGYNVVMTRESNDAEISEAARARTANLAGSDILVHVSCGFSEDAATKGVLAYAPTYESPSLENRLVSASQHLAEDILVSVSSQTGQNNLGILDGDRMTGINWAEVPVVVFQAGFLSNVDDEKLLTGGWSQNRTVTGIANGIDLYFKEQG